MSSLPSSTTAETTDLRSETDPARTHSPSTVSPPSPDEGDGFDALSDEQFDEAWQSPTSSSASLDRWLVQRLLTAYRPCPVRVVLWDGATFDGLGVDGRPIRDPEYTVRIASRQSLYRLMLKPEYHFLEGYAQGTIEVKGDLAGLLRFLHQAQPDEETFRDRIKSQMRRVLPVSTRTASRKNISHHYDIGNEFYRIWLDKQLLYTCAYYETDKLSLEEAQIAKMHHICRKLRLQPGEKVIEAGCGWGAFALHMARHYDVHVQAYNISKEQLRYARERAKAEGLEDRVEFIEEDWRGIRGSCDAFVSVGMLEHVGPENYGELGTVIRSCLKSDGRGLIHTIGQNTATPLNPWIERRIFPGAQPPTLKQMMEIFQASGTAVLDVENLRMHYARTLHHWLERFEHAASAVRNMFDETFVRVWRMYLASSQAAFETGRLELFQTLFAPVGHPQAATTRADWYEHLWTSP